MARKRNYLINNGYLQRLNDAYNAAGFNAVKLGKVVDKERKTIYGYLEGITTPDALTLARICVALNISADWLLFGSDNLKQERRDECDIRD